MRNGLFLVGIALGFALLTGCAATSVTLDVVAVKPVNELDGKSRVTDIRIYQLKDNARFDNADIDALWTNANETLGDSLIGEPRTGDSIFPEDRQNAQGKKIEVELKDEARYIGILALYSESDEVGKQFVSVPVDEAGSVVFELTGYHITVKRN